MSRTLVRIAPWVLLLLCAYALGRWQGRNTLAGPDHGRSSVQPGDGAEPAHSAAPDSTSAETPPATRAARLTSELADLHAAARTMSAPNARTYAFFENLQLEDLPAIADQIRAMPSGNEQDLFFAMAIRRWAQLDAPAALAAAARFPILGTRQSAELAAWEAWGAHDPQAAMARAGAAEPGRARDQSLAALLLGAATRDPREALALWQATPEDFRTAAFGPAALDQIVTGACGTGKREAVQTLIREMPAGETQDRLAAALCSEWGAHYPDDALLWLSETLPEGEGRLTGMTRIFESLVRKDPSLAATWGASFPDEKRRSGMIASAVSTWAEINPIEAELWINEQADSPELDGATFAMAAHFIGAKNMPKAFAWIRRIRRDEARSELLGNLGRAWSKERPAEFRQFLDQNSLNRAELDSLLSKIDPAG